MSEYQYYEFIAIDKPLTSKQMAALRDCSSRADITPTSFVNDYQWGDLKANPRDWMTRYFDAHVYVANWCTCIFSLRLPKAAFNAKDFSDFKTEISFSVNQTKAHWLLEWAIDESDNYDRFAMDDGRGWMGRLTPLRDELLRGDIRSLYLGWLAGVSMGEISDEATEPDPPPGLSSLTAAQQALVEFLEIDKDLLSAAGSVDSPRSRQEREDDKKLDDWIAAFPTAEKNKMLKLLLTGSGQQAERQMKRRFQAWMQGQLRSAQSARPLRKVADLRQLAASAAKVRERQVAIQREKAELELQTKRETYLRTLADDFNRYWRTVDKLVARGIASAYDEAANSLVDLSDAYALYATRAEFDRKLAKFMIQHGNRRALIRRLVDVGLWRK